MAKKQKQASPKLASGLPVAPWIFINNSLGTGNSYAGALCSLIPYSRIYESLQPLSSIYQDLEPHTISILANSSTAAYLTANIASSYQVQARERGCNLASVALCNDDTFNDFVDMDKKEWQSNHIIINVDGTSIEEVAKMIIRWLFTVFSVRETLYLISEAEMLAIDTKMFAEFEYCSLQQARYQPKEAKVQFVTLIASKPELTEPNKLTWKVVDRSGEANFYFYHRGPTSQPTWDWVLGLQVGDRKVLARMPMIALHEPIAKKILLSPLRATGATIRGVGHVTMGAGRAFHWVGDKVGMRRQETDKYIAEADYEAHMKKKTERTERAWKKMTMRTTTKKKKQQKQRGEGGEKEGGESVGNDRIGSHEVNKNEKEESDFKIFNEKGEKTWNRGQDDGASTSTATASLVDEKVEREFC